MDDLYLKVANVQGESKDASHKGWIDLVGYNWGGSRFAAGNATVNYRNLIAHALIDKANPVLFSWLSSGKIISKVEVSMCRAGSNIKEYHRITLENAFVADISIENMMGQPTATYEFQADKMKIQYWEQTTNGGRGAETVATWDIKNNCAR